MVRRSDEWMNIKYSRNWWISAHLKNYLYLFESADRKKNGFVNWCQVAKEIVFFSSYFKQKKKNYYKKKELNRIHLILMMLRSIRFLFNFCIVDQVKKRLKFKFKAFNYLFQIKYGSSIRSLKILKTKDFNETTNLFL